MKVFINIDMKSFHGRGKHLTKQLQYQRTEN